uniref:Amino acid permease n=1 Tax=Caenorhabditis japonica TaxID=281687 RepID=A0A8R1E075_CAEJA
MSSEEPPTVGDIAAKRHQMGLWSCMSYVIANIVGAGIFITPGPILQYTYSNGLALVVWIGCGLISLIVAGLDPVWHLEHPYSEIFERGLGFALIIVLTILNLYAIDKYASKFQVVVTIAKLLSLAVIIATGFYFLVFKGWTQNLEHPFAGSNTSPGQISLAFYGALWSFAGWDILNYGTPEIYKPRRTMPIALLGGVTIVTLIYLAMNISYMTVLTPGQIMNSTAVAADFAQVTLGNFSYAIPFMIALLLIGTLNSNIFCGSRFTHAAAREGHLPTFLSCINEESNSPRAALLFQLICTIAVTFVDTNSLINYVAFVMFGQRVFTMTALMWIRYRDIPVAPDAIRVPIIFSLLFWIITIALVVVPFIEETTHTIVGVGLVLMGLVLYLIFMKPKRLPQFLTNFNDGMTRITCKVLFTTPDLKHHQDEEKIGEHEQLSPRFTHEPILNQEERATLQENVSRM